MNAKLANINVKKVAGIFALAAFLLTVGFYYLFTTLKERLLKPDPSKSGLNISLPSANLDEKFKNKLDLYIQAHQDSLKMEAERGKDKYLKLSEAATTDTFPENVVPGTYKSTQLPQHSPEKNNEQKVAEAINKLQQAITATVDTPKTTHPAVTHSGIEDTEEKHNINHLEKLVTHINTSAPDTELQQLDGMLDKIMEIQNPERARQKLIAKDSSVTNTVLAFAPNGNAENDNSFYGLEQEAALTDSVMKPGNAISAVVHDNQVLVTGGTVKLRLLQDVYIQNERIPANTFVYGLGSLSNERLNLEIRKIIYNHAVFPVKLTVLDSDGINGIYVPGAVAGDVGKEGLNQAIQTMELYSADPSIAAQAATAGIQAAKSLVAKKTKAVPVTLKAGHAVLLANNNLL